MEWLDVPFTSYGHSALDGALVSYAIFACARTSDLYDGETIVRANFKNYKNCDIQSTIFHVLLKINENYDYQINGKILNSESPNEEVN